MFTNDEKELIRAKEYREALNADGWAMTATYEGHESAERYSSHEKDGYKAHVCSRENVGAKYRYETGVHFWGPNGIAIKAPQPYSLDALKANEYVCDFCGKTVASTRRVAFANRSCDDCLDAARKKLEYRGWCD